MFTVQKNLLRQGVDLFFLRIIRKQPLWDIMQKFLELNEYFVPKFQLCVTNRLYLSGLRHLGVGHFTKCQIARAVVENMSHVDPPVQVSGSVSEPLWIDWGTSTYIYICVKEWNWPLEQSTQMGHLVEFNIVSNISILIVPWHSLKVCVLCLSVWLKFCLY